jgi:hypothetical protein
MNIMQEIMSLVSAQETQITEEQRAAKKAERAAVKAIWKTLADAKKITSQDVAALCLLRSLKSNDTENTRARLLRAFKPITNKIKLENGAAPFGALELALRWLKYSEFAKQLPEDTQKQMEALAKETLSKGLK